MKNWNCSFTERQKRSHRIKSVLNVLEESCRKPIKVRTDAGVEYTNRAFKYTLKKQNIHVYVTVSENKAVVVERFNRTLKSLMWRYVTHNNTDRYVDVLQELVSGYNTSPHKGVGMAPIEVNYSNQLKIRKKYYSQRVNRKPFNLPLKITYVSVVIKVCLRKDTFRVARKNMLS